MISNLPEADSAKRLLQRVATQWDPEKKTPLLGKDRAYSLVSSPTEVHHQFLGKVSSFGCFALRQRFGSDDACRIPGRHQSGGKDRNRDGMREP